jgi:hypothetical protein
MQCQCLFICRGNYLSIGGTAATQGSDGLDALLHYFFGITGGDIFIKFELSKFLLFCPFWAVLRVGAVVAGAVGAVSGVCTLRILVLFLAALHTNCLTVAGGFAITVALAIVAP